MKILFLAQRYSPEDISAAILISELAVDLAKRGHQVTMITEVPNYPHGKVFPGYRNKLYQEEVLEGVRVIRTWSAISPKKEFWPRIFNYGAYSATSLYGGLLAGKHDVVVNYSPPLPLGISAWLLSRAWGVPWVLQIEDLYPDAAIAAGVLKNQRVIALFKAIERFLYRHAQHISLISESFRKNLLGKGVPPEKMTLIPVWADPDIVRPMPRENAFRQQHGLEGKFVVMYSGNMGFTSCLEDALAAADLLRGQQDTAFVLIGEGVQKAALEEMAREKGLENVIFLPYQPRDLFPEMLAAADIHLVTLNASSSHSSLPSKVFNAMASARPILAVAPAESDLAHVVRSAQCGVLVPPEAPQQLANTIRALRESDPAELDRLGAYGRAELETNYARARCIEKYEQMLIRLCPAAQVPRNLNKSSTSV